MSTRTTRYCPAPITAPRSSWCPSTGWRSITTLVPAAAMLERVGLAEAVELAALAEAAVAGGPVVAWVELLGRGKRIERRGQHRSGWRQWRARGRRCGRRNVWLSRGWTRVPAARLVPAARPAGAVARAGQPQGIQVACRARAGVPAAGRQATPAARARGQPQEIQVACRARAGVSVAGRQATLAARARVAKKAAIPARLEPRPRGQQLLRLLVYDTRTRASERQRRVAVARIRPPLSGSPAALREDDVTQLQLQLDRGTLGLVLSALARTRSRLAFPSPPKRFIRRGPVFGAIE